jgi:glycosyltransferase involved in cell wall biosynthesis
VNIAIFIDTLSGGGAEKVMLTLAKGWVAQNHAVHFFLLSGRTEYPVPDGVFVHVLSKQSHRKQIKWWRINQTAKNMEQLLNQVEQQHGVFHLKLANLDPTCAVINKSKIPDVFYVLHNAMEEEIKRDAQINRIKKWKKQRAKQVYNHKHLIAVSKGVADEANSQRFIKPASVTTIYNPVDFSEIETASEEQIQLPNEDYLIHIGRVVKQKRHDVLFKALRDIPNVKLVLLCKYVEKARKLAKQYGVEDRLITPGFQNNPYPWLKHAKALVSSSDFEGLGMNLIEALACDTPVVSTDCPYGPNEILTGNLAEYLVPVGNHQLLAQKVLSVLQHSPTIDHQRLRDTFSIEQATQSYLKLAKANN